METTEFVYTTYIRATPQKVWDAITNPEFSRQYWVEGIVSDWKTGSRWHHYANPERDAFQVAGEVLESVPPKLLVISWAPPQDLGTPTLHSRVRFAIEPLGDMVRLSVTHDRLITGSDMAMRISGGWPRVLSSLKSLVETGTALDTWAGHPAEIAHSSAQRAGSRS